MESTARSPLHPLLTVAAVAVTVFSAIGVATLTGMIPASRGTPKDAAPQVRLVEAPAPAPVADAPKPRPVVKKRAAPRAPVPEPIYREAGEAPIAQAAPTLAARPVAQPGVLGMVESVTEAEEPGDAKRLGAVGGAIAGNQVEKQARGEKRWDVTVRLDDGTTQTFSSPSAPLWRAGDRVRVHEGQLLNS